jgi:dienelactone hydrolase
VVLLGWSHGGSTTLAAAAAPVPEGLLRGAIAFYPGCGVLQRRGGWAPAVPLLMLLGGADNWTAPGNCQALAAAWPGQVEMVIYAGANHGFDGPGIPIRTRTLPDGRMVTTGTDDAARAAVLLRVPAFLAAHAGNVP